jgi:hypothetical protein
MDDVINPSFMMPLPTPIWQCCPLNARVTDVVPTYSMKTCCLMYSNKAKSVATYIKSSTTGDLRQWRVLKVIMITLFVH